MAENEEKEAAKEGKEGEGAEKKASPLKAMMIPVAASAVTSIIVGVVMIMLLAPKAPPVGDEGEEGAAAEHGEKEKKPHGEGKEGAHGEKKEEGGSQTGIFQKFDPFIVTVFDHEKVHYLKASLALELNSEDVKEELAAKDPQIRDSLVFVLGDFTLRELLDNQAKLMVKDVMVKTLNKILGEGKVINVYFTEFTIQ